MLHAILCWYDEPPTWLAGCVASLSRVGVQHLVAVDGRYPHFNQGAPARSRLEQVDAIFSAAEAIDIGVTMHRPVHADATEPMKRTRCFQLLNQIATPMRDWVLVIDADEIITSGTGDLMQELASLPEDTHIASSRLTHAMDPYAEPGPDNNITSKTRELHQKLDVPMEYTTAQSRLWRVLHDMRVERTHYSYTGVDDAGVRWNLRPDIGTLNHSSHPEATIARLDNSITIQHRKNHRTAERRRIKTEYYSLRDELGLERLASV